METNKTDFGKRYLDSIDFKINFVKKHCIALYDVVAKSDISGSSDSDLTKSKMLLSDISFLLPPHTSVEKIICNGKASYEILTKNYDLNLPIIYLPSTSPANPRFDFNAWLSELGFLKEN